MHLTKKKVYDILLLTDKGGEIMKHEIVFPQPNTETLFIRLPKELRDKIEELANQKNISMSDIVRTFIEKGIKEL